MNFENIFPLIVPSSYYKKGTWELPHQQLSNKEFLLTWVCINAENGMTYLQKGDFDELNKNEFGWQQKAFENLRNSIAQGENFFTHQTQRQSIPGLKFIAFIHSDGLGSSRILLNYELRYAFQEGYYVAFPDRSCGVVIPKNLSKRELKEVKQLIKSMYKNATTPMSRELHNPEEFTLPDTWLRPINESNSQLFIAEILKLK